MTEEAFRNQAQRLTSRWPKSFDAESLKLIARGLKDLPDYTVERIVTHFLLTMRAAPLPQDFVDAGHKERKRLFERDVSGSANAVFNWGEQKGLRAFLDEFYPGCKTLWEAVQIQVELNQAQREREG